MTTRVGGDEVNTQKHVRFFVQPGGPRPSNPVYYSGVSNTYLNIESTPNPVRGGISPINVHDPRQIGRYRQVGNTVDAPDFPTITVQFMQKKDALPRHLVDLLDCYTNFYQVIGSCKDPGDFLSGWSSFVKVHSHAQATQPTEAGGSFDGDESLMDEVEFTLIGGVSNVGKLGFGERGSVQVYSKVKGITYGNRIQCQSCGPSDNGTKLIFAVTDNTVASPGQAPACYYSTDGGVTWTEQAITGSVSTDVPTAIAIVGNYLVITYDDGSAGGYWYSEINQITGAPSTSWTNVTTGFISGGTPQDMYAASSSEIWFSGDGGYIYKSTNIISGVTAVLSGDVTTNSLSRISGLDEVIIAGANAGSLLLVSLDRGLSWSTMDGAFNDMSAITAVWVVDDYLWWVGGVNDAGDGGTVEYTEDQGNTWTVLTLPTLASVEDIVFSTPEVGYIACTTAGPVAKLYATWNGGYSWTNASPRILNIPTADQFYRVAVPEAVNSGVLVNNVAIGGLAGNGSDGIVLVASAQQL